LACERPDSGAVAGTAQPDPRGGGPRRGHRPKVLPIRTQVLAMIDQATDPRMRVPTAYAGAMEDRERIVRDPAVMAGRACIRGTRVTVSTTLGQLAAGHSVSEVMEAYPYLEEADIRAALSYGARAVPRHGFHGCLSVSARDRAGRRSPRQSGLASAQCPAWPE
jgi:uncharacterized protein (DUF433 family)